MKNKRKKVKVKKLTSVPILIRRLFRLASQMCRERAHFSCEICGMKQGDKHANTGKPQRVEAHHIISRKHKDCPLRFDLRNLVCLCSEHHKFGLYSAHGHGVWFTKELEKIRPDDVKWILEHTNDKVDLSNRETLTYIEECLIKGIPLNFPQNTPKSSPD